MESTPAPTPMPAGWGCPGLSPKAHWFPEGEAISICERWMYSGPRTDGPVPGDKGPDDCPQCWKKLLKLKWTKNDGTEDGRFVIQTEREHEGAGTVTWCTLCMSDADYAIYKSIPGADAAQHGPGAKAKLRKLAQEIATRRGFVAEPEKAVMQR